MVFFLVSSLKIFAPSRPVVRKRPTDDTNTSNELIRPKHANTAPFKPVTATGHSTLKSVPVELLEKIFFCSLDVNLPARRLA